jgi:hypothetical protein
MDMPDDSDSLTALLVRALYKGLRLLTCNIYFTRIARSDFSFAFCT